MFGWDSDEHEDAVPATRFDLMSWRGLRMESPSVEAMIGRLRQGHDYVESFVLDMYSSLSQADPRVRTSPEMLPTHLPLRDIIDGVHQARSLEGLREHTLGDPFATVLALGSMEPELKRLLEQAEELKEAAQAAQDAADAADAAQEAGDPDAGDLADAAAAAAQDLQQQSQDAAAAQTSSLQKMVNQAMDKVEDTKEAMSAYGVEPGDYQKMNPQERMALAHRLTSSKKLQEFAKIIGRFKQLAQAEYRRKFTSGSDEVVGLELGNDLTRLSGQERINMAIPEMADDFWLRYASGELLVHQTRGRERAGKGPIIVIGDESASMDGAPEAWMKGLALALLDQAHKGNRDFHYVGFAGPGVTRHLSFPGGKAPIEDTITLAEGFLNGGTSFDAPMRIALDLMKESGEAKPDVVFVTDGNAPLPAFLSEWNDTRERLSVVSYGVFIGQPNHLAGETLEAVTDNVRTISDVMDVTSMTDVLRA